MTFALFSCQHTGSVSANDIFTTQSGKQIKIECYRHASLNIVYDGHSIQIDPVNDPAHHILYQDKTKADYILITHEHFDHFDMKAISELSKQNTQVILNKNCFAKLGRGTVMTNGDSLTLACGIGIRAVPAYNTTPSHQQYHPQGRDNGYVLTIENIRIYIAGDTEVIPVMKELKNIDIAFLPCNQPYTMTTAQLVEAAKIIRPRILYPYHYSDTDMSGIAGQLKNDRIEVRLRDMQ
jgi:L-ascorbate metabolism protein UlaG (beta-lactamase superfamily)